MAIRSIFSRRKNSLSLYFIITLAFCQVLSIFTGVASTFIVGGSSTVFAASNVNNFSFESFEVDYYLSRDEDGVSRLKVVETLVANFPQTSQNHGITRIIPYTNQDGKNLTMASDSDLKIEILHNGIAEQPYKIESGDGYFTVSIGDADKHVKGKHTYTLTYEFQNVITEQDSYDGGFKSNDYINEKGIIISPLSAWQELYWDTNGNDWSQAFGYVDARVHFGDTNIADAYQNLAWCYVGKYSTSNSSRCQIEDIEDGVRFFAANLAAGENLTFDIQFADNTFAISERPKSYLFYWVFAGSLAIAAIAVYKICKDKQKNVELRNFYNHYPIHPEFTPYKNMHVSDMAENYIGKISLKSSETATLLELAVTHKIKILELAPESKFGGKKYAIEILDTKMTAAQDDVLRILNGGNSFREGEVIQIKKQTATNALMRIQKDYKSHNKNHCRQVGLFAKTEEPEYNFLAAGWGIILFTIVGVLVLIIIPENKPWVEYVMYGSMIALSAATLAVVSVALILHDLSTVADCRTKEGLEVSRYLDGINEYIKLAEAERLKLFQSTDGAKKDTEGVISLYEKLLPYAVLLGQEKTWLNELSKYYDEIQPDWYSGTDVFNAAYFATALSGLTKTTSTNLYNATHSGTSGSSSGFSGGGGGGFSGGGGGGGGGGGW